MAKTYADPGVYNEIESLKGLDRVLVADSETEVTKYAALKNLLPPEILTKLRYAIVHPYSGYININTENKTISTTGRLLIAFNGGYYDITATQDELEWVGFQEYRDLHFIVLNQASLLFRVIRYSELSNYPPEDNILIGSYNQIHGTNYALTNGPIKINGVLHVGSGLPFESESLYNLIFPDKISWEKLQKVNYQSTANLFNKDTISKGYYGTDGVTFQPSEQYYTSDFIRVQTGASYKRSNGDTSVYVYAYDLEYNPVVVGSARVYYLSDFEGKEIPPEVSYVKLIVRPSDLHSLMLTEYDVRTDYFIPYEVPKISTDLIDSDVAPEIAFDSSEMGPVAFNEFDTDYSHLIFYGQSLSMGWEAHEALTTQNYPGTYMIGDRVWINQGNDGSVSLNPLVASISPNCGESPAVASTNSFKRLFDRFHRRGKQVDFISTNCGDGGKSIERLSKESTNGTNFYTTLFLTSIQRAKQIANNNLKSISCPAIVWMQGEYNYTNLTGEGLTSAEDATNDKDTYKSLLLTLKNNMQADVMAEYGQSEPPLFFMYQVGGSYINLENMTINMAMIEFAAENKDVVLMNPTYGVPDYGGGHLSSNGYRWYGELIAKSFYKTFLKGKKSDVVFAEKVDVYKDKVVIECNVPVAPLVFDTDTSQPISDFGFKLRQDGVEVDIESVSIVDGCRLVIKPVNQLSGLISVAYGGYGRSGSGNVRDSDKWYSQYYYADETNLVKPNYTPVDESGDNYYNKDYPMYNWLVAFYYEQLI